MSRPDGYQDGQEELLGALGLITNTVELWITIYMQAALAHLREEGEAVCLCSVRSTLLLHPLQPK
ncbi:transposase [Salmonella enterica]|nr:transposase [Salmonella enterica]